MLTLNHGPYQFNISFTFYEDGTFDSDLEQVGGPQLSMAELSQMYPLLQRRIDQLAASVMLQQQSAVGGAMMMRTVLG